MLKSLRHFEACLSPIKFQILLDLKICSNHSAILRLFPLPVNISNIAEHYNLRISIRHFETCPSSLKVSNFCKRIKLAHIPPPFSDLSLSQYDLKFCLIICFAYISLQLCLMTKIWLNPSAILTLVPLPVKFPDIAKYHNMLISVHRLAPIPPPFLRLFLSLQNFRFC